MRWLHLEEILSDSQGPVRVGAVPCGYRLWIEVYTGPHWIITEEGQTVAVRYIFTHMAQIRELQVQCTNPSFVKRCVAQQVGFLLRWATFSHRTNKSRLHVFRGDHAA